MVLIVETVKAELKMSKLIEGVAECDVWNGKCACHPFHQSALRQSVQPDKLQIKLVYQIILKLSKDASR